MADEPKEPTSQAPDPEDALGQAGDAADRAAEGIEKSPEADENAAAALAAAMEAVNQVKQNAEAAMSGAGPASPGKPASQPGARPAAKTGVDAAGAAPFRLQDLGATLSAGRKETLDLLSDVQLHVRIELGRTRMYVEDVLQLGDGAVVELDKLAGDPVDVFVNDRHVARGEVLVLNDNFCVRINEILDPGAERAG